MAKFLRAMHGLSITITNPGYKVKLYVYSETIYFAGCRPLLFISGLVCCGTVRNWLVSHKFGVTFSCFLFLKFFFIASFTCKYTLTNEGKY